MLVDVKNTIASYGPPTSKIWVTETLYNLLGNRLTNWQINIPQRF